MFINHNIGEPFAVFYFDILNRLDGNVSNNSYIKYYAFRMTV